MESGAVDSGAIDSGAIDKGATLSTGSEPGAELSSRSRSSGAIEASGGPIVGCASGGVID